MGRREIRIIYCKKMEFKGRLCHLLTINKSFLLDFAVVLSG